MRTLSISKGIHSDPPRDPSLDTVLSGPALEFLLDLHGRFEPVRRTLLQARTDRQKRFDQGELPAFLPKGDPAHGSWQVSAIPADLEERKVEITGPTDRKMMINALNSGASCYMADFEDSNSPTWRNLLEGQRNLSEAIRRTLEFTSPDGRVYRLNPRVATLLVRPRGWHLEERHVRVDGANLSASLFDVGLFVFHNAKTLVDRGTGVYLYLPKLEGRAEAKLWNDVFDHMERQLGLPASTIRATVLIETLPAAFEMEEILWELRTHALGLNAGRWDYIFSLIKKLRSNPGFVLPDRANIRMDLPFLRAYTRRLIDVCHAHGAHAMGGMSAFIPDRRDPAVTELALKNVRADKLREIADGFDGTWVAHPDLVTLALDVFNKSLGTRPHQRTRVLPPGTTEAKDLLNVQIPNARATAEGLRANVRVGVRYLESWLRGVGAAAIEHLMEDAATAEICRTQLWQWARHGARLDDGRTVNAELVRDVLRAELQRLRETLGDDVWARSRFPDAAELFEQVALAEPFVEFLTIPAYERLE